MNQVIRIIGGKFRGKKIPFANIDGLRPTPDRVKETLFNWLMHDIRGANCLDAFAGSGALGLEAFSRGAETVTFIEASSIVYDGLKKIIQSFSEKSMTVVNTDVRLFLQKTSLIFDIIFLDPPFCSNYLEESINALQLLPCLKQSGLLYIESDKNHVLDAKHWREIKSKKAGQVFYSLYEKL